MKEEKKQAEIRHGKKFQDYKTTINMNVYFGSNAVIYNPSDYIIEHDRKHGQIIQNLLDAEIKKMEFTKAIYITIGN